MSRIMAHMVSHYPDRDSALSVAEGIVEGGAAFLEIQFPFSDPTADGPAIQAACQTALRAGFTVDQGFRFVREVREQHDIPIFIMTYASLVFARGVREFLIAGRDAGATGFILPDLSPDYDEGAFELASELGTTIMPVIVTSMREERLDRLTGLALEYLYVALRRGITGERTHLAADTIGFLDRLKSLGVRVMAGFGISERSQVMALDDHAYAAIVGSALVRTVTETASRTARLNPADRRAELRAALTTQVTELVG